MVFLPLGRNNEKGTLLKMYGGPKTYSSIPMLMLMMLALKPIPKNHLSPQFIKIPLTIVIHKDPQSHQPIKIDHVEKGH